MGNQSKPFRRYVSPFGRSFEVGPDGQVPENRTLRLIALVTLDEFTAVRTAAFQAELSVSAWLREAVMVKLQSHGVKVEQTAQLKRQLGIDHPHESPGARSLVRTPPVPPDVLDLDQRDVQHVPSLFDVSDLDDETGDE